MQQTKKFIQADKISEAKIGLSSFLLNTETGIYFELNQTATAVWELLKEPKSEDEIINILSDGYNSIDEISKDIVSFLETAINKKIIKLVWK